MNKRILIYFLALIGAFFFFQYWSSSPSPKRMEKPATSSIVIDPSLRKETALSEEEMASYNLVKLYSDLEEKEFVTYAIQQNLSYLAFSWAKNLPPHLYARYDESPNANINRLDPVVDPGEIGAPALYSAYKSEKLKIPHTPSYKSFEVELLSFPEDGKEVSLYYGEVIDEKMSRLSALPSSRAFVFVGRGTKYFPYAVFDPKDGSLTPLISVPGFELLANIISLDAPPITPKQEEEPYYVLENGYTQLVFSTKRGAIFAINLPFANEKNPSNPVREIDFDRILAKDYAMNDAFPQRPYLVVTKKGEAPELRQPQVGGYYPLLRRDIMGIGGKPSLQIPTQTYAFAMTAAEPTKSSDYVVKRFEKNLIEFELIEENRRFTKIYTLPENPDEAPYCFDVSIKLEGDARDQMIGLGVPEVELISGSFTPVLKYQVTRNGKRAVEKIDPPKKHITLSHVQPNWVCNSNGFFGIIAAQTAAAPPGLAVRPLSGELVPSRITLIDAGFQRFPISKYPGYEMQVPLDPNTGIAKMRVFAGPFDKEILAKVDAAYTNFQTGESPDFNAVLGSNGWFSFISEPFAKFLFFLMNFFYNLTHSWGFSILLLTVALRIMLYPLNSWSIKSTLKMQAISPKITAIQEKYKKDPKQAQLQIMNLYRESGVNPFSGCLPLLIQMPFLIGMFDLLKSSFELRGAPFIPGWIDNLAAPDLVFSWDYPLIFFGNSFHLLPFLLGAVMYLQQRYSSATPGTTPKKLTDQQRQQRMVGNIMVVVFTVMFYNFPSGLNLYWLFSMLLGIAQQWWTTKRMQKQPPAVVVLKK